MVWTAPKQFQEGEILTARDLNVYLRDNMLENEVMKAQTPGSRLSTDVHGSLVERTFAYDVVNTAESKISNSMVQTGTYSFTYSPGPTNLGEPGPQVSVETGTKALCFYSCTFKTNILAERNGWDDFVSAGVDCTTSPGNRLLFQSSPTPRSNRMRFSITKGASVSVSNMCVFSGLTPGNNTFVMRYFLGSPEAIFEEDSGDPDFGQLVGWRDVISTFSNRQLLVIPI